MRRGMLIVVASTLIVAVSAVMAQTGTRGQGRGARSYNPANEITVKGTVQDVMQTSGQRGWAGVHLSLKSDQGVYDVHVGPASYISSQQFTFAKGDQVEVLGAKANVNGKDVLLARQITKGGKTLTLRDENGFPKWSRAGGQARR